MLRSIVATAVLLLAASAVRAEDVWRWTDEAGHIHYSLFGNNPHELADQVKQASLLDTLGVPWRRATCR
jgi:hypothetical protein